MRALPVELVAHFGLPHWRCAIWYCPARRWVERAGDGIGDRLCPRRLRRHSRRAVARTWYEVSDPKL